MCSYLVYETLNIIFSVVGTYEPYPSRFHLHLCGMSLFSLENGGWVTYMETRPKFHWALGTHPYQSKVNTPLDRYPTRHMSWCGSSNHQPMAWYWIWANKSQTWTYGSFKIVIPQRQYPQTRTNYWLTTMGEFPSWYELFLSYMHWSEQANMQYITSNEVIMSRNNILTNISKFEEVWTFPIKRDSCCPKP